MPTGHATRARTAAIGTFAELLRDLRLRTDFSNDDVQKNKSASSECGGAATANGLSCCRPLLARSIKRSACAVAAASDSAEHRLSKWLTCDRKSSKARHSASPTVDSFGAGPLPALDNHASIAAGPSKHACSHPLPSKQGGGLLRAALLTANHADVTTAASLHA